MVTRDNKPYRYVTQMIRESKAYQEWVAKVVTEHSVRDSFNSMTNPVTVVSHGDDGWILETSLKFFKNVPGTPGSKKRYRTTHKEYTKRWKVKFEFEIEEIE